LREFQPTTGRSLIDDVISREELVALSEGYKRIAGYSKEARAADQVVQIVPVGQARYRLGTESNQEDGVDKLLRSNLGLGGEDGFSTAGGASPVDVISASSIMSRNSSISSRSADFRSTAADLRGGAVSRWF
jgi:hypothetical protein